MTALPALMPVTRPELISIIATPVDPDSQVPPVAASLRVVEDPEHTVAGPVMAGKVVVFTVISFVATAEPHVPETAYEIVTLPAVTPVTTPPETVALPLLALHVPPDTPSVRVIFAPVLTVDAPEIVPAVAALTVTTAITELPDAV